MSFEIASALTGAGRTVYDDGIARGADIGDGQVLLECAGNRVECHLLEVVEAAQALIRRVGGYLPVLSAVRALVIDAEHALDEVDG